MQKQLVQTHMLNSFQQIQQVECESTDEQDTLSVSKECAI